MAFYKAHDFSIETATINSKTYNGVTHTHYQGRTMGSDPMRILSAARAVEATHTSRTASYAPKCKPGSRARVIQDIMTWINNEGTVTSSKQGAVRTSILWFQGPAGGGKTCIMREVVSRCVKRGILGASYFFSSRVRGLDNEGPFVATIVHQLIARAPALKAAVLQAISEEPDIFRDSLDAQVEKLLIDPFLSIESPFLPATSASGKRVIVIDGFDECWEPKERTHLLEILFTLVTSTPHFLIVLSSRPEFDIRTAFATQPLALITHLLRLDSYSGTSDIRNFYCDEFHRIRSTHPAKNAIPFDWPGEGFVRILVDNASGSYIYPSTVIKHVDNPRRNPVALLEEVMKSATGKDAGCNHLSDLDALYTHILHPSGTDMSLLKRLLHCIMGLQISCPPSFFDGLLSLPAGTTEITLCDVHSVIKMPDSGTSDPILLHHNTMKDYLKSPERAGDLYQSFQQTNLDIAVACMVHLRDGASVRATQEIVRSYSTFYWASYVQQSFGNSPEDGLAALQLLPASIRDFDPLPAWKYGFVTYHLVPNLWTRDAIHKTICEPLGTDTCVPFCSNSARIETLQEKFNQLWQELRLRDQAKGTSWAQRESMAESVSCMSALERKALFTKFARENF
ncbi:hypothetical protein NMY22_g10363 [Coprinellus aureogranulatus]|nr:hypothetical protein NMY22_g10363 [Coprinellus aureogranulatus]